jgi:outer membrane immunogenic protein
VAEQLVANQQVASSSLARRSNIERGIPHMRIFIAIMAALLGLAAATSSRAADIRGSTKDTPAHLLPSAETPASWTSIWAAALAGYSMSNTDLSLSIFDNHESSDSFGDRVGGGKLSGLGGEGFDATLQLGGDYQISQRVLVGGWAEYAFGGTESSARVDAGGHTVGRLDVDQNDSYGLFARAGLIFGDTMVYGAGGYVWTEADAKLSAGEETLRRTFDFSGPAAELGIEHRFTPSIRGKLSARYTWFDEETVGRWEDFCERYQLDAEPGVLSVKAGVVISTSGIFTR